MMSRVGPAMKSGCIGPPEAVREPLMRYADMGIELVLLKSPSVMLTLLPFVFL